LWRKDVIAYRGVFAHNDLVWANSVERSNRSYSKKELREGEDEARKVSESKYMLGIDVTTGEIRRKVPLNDILISHHHYRCYEPKATARYIMTARRGTEFISLDGGEHRLAPWVRATCQHGIIPCNGLVYYPSHSCQCYSDYKLNGFNALAAGRGIAGTPEFPLERGPAYSEASGEPAEITAADWPTFRADAARSSSVKSSVDPDVKRMWRKPVGTALSPPTVVGDRVYVAAVDAHQVMAFSSRDGRPLWTFTADARVDSPPTCHAGSVLFGSADGWVYCLRADDGALRWRLRGAPRERMVGCRNQLESAWPVHGSVLVRDGVVYFAAGRSSFLDGGIYLFAVEAATGRILHKRRLDTADAPLPTLHPEHLLDEYSGYLNDILMSEGASLFLRNKKFSLDLTPARGTPFLSHSASCFDDSYFIRISWKGGSQLVAYDAARTYSLWAYAVKGRYNKSFIPGKKGYRLMAAGKRATTWEQYLPIRVLAMVATPEILFVAGPPDVVVQDDPLGAFEGRKGGVLRAINATDGKTCFEIGLDSPPVFNGMAAARGRLFLATADGSIICMGKR